MRKCAELLSLIEHQINKKGLPPAEISRLAVGNPYLIYNFRKKGFDPKYKTLRSLCQVLDLEFYIGPPRGAVSAESSALPPPAWDFSTEAPNIAPLAAIPSEVTDMLGLPAGSDADAVVRAMEAKIVGRGTAHATSAAVLDRRAMGQMLRSETKSLKDDLAAMLDARLPPQDEDGRSMTIRHLALRQAHDVRAAGGFGEEIFEEPETGTLYIAADDLPPNLDTDRLVGIRAAGRSMEPTIHDEDVLVLNPDATDPREGAVFVIRTDSGLVVKRLHREGDTWTMTSDAPGWEPRPVTGQDRIIGHVVWFGPEGVIVQE